MTVEINEFSDDPLPLTNNQLEEDYQHIKNKYSNFLKLQYQEESKTLIFGNVVFDKFMQFKGRKEFAKYLLWKNGIKDEVPEHPKYFNKCMMEMLGYPLSHVYKIYRQLSWKVFIVPYQDLIAKIHFQRNRIHIKTLGKIIETESLLRQAQKDGLDNLLPIIMETGMNPQELKKAMGNTWKVIANNSLNKNKFLARSIDLNWKTEHVSKIKYCASFPTTVLQFHGHNEICVLQHITEHYKGVWSKNLERETVQLLDTKSLAEQLEKPFNPLWSPRRMKEEHDSMSKELTARKFSPDKLKVLDDVSVKEFEYEGYNAVLLDSRALIADEGNVMRHCVAGYAESVAQGNYLVYSISKDGVKSSTLGITKKNWGKIDNASGMKDPYYIFNQHYARWNINVVDEHEKKIGQLIIEELNKEEPCG